MYESTQDAVWVHGIDLAQEADFDLGSLRVRPARCEVEWNGVSQTLQRRVMQVLVALAQERDAVVSQGDLVIRCWRGLSVSDDAIYRCISKLRKLAADYPHPPFEIEAIQGIGYRLESSKFENDPAVSAALKDGRFRLRGLTAAVLVVVTAVVAAWMLHGRAAGDRPLRVAVEPLEILGDSAEVRSLARSVPNAIVDALGDSQIETVLTEVTAGKAAIAPPGPAPGLIITGILRDDGHVVIADVRIEDGATRAALWSTEFRRNDQEASDLPLEVAARIADIVNMTNFARNANPPLIDDSALTPLLQTHDMIRDAHGGQWAPMIENARDVVARHPEFAFGHSVLAAAYAEAANSNEVPGQAPAMRDAARREARLALKIDPEDAGAYAALSQVEGPYDYRTRELILLRGIKFGRHPKEPLGALYSYEGRLLERVGRLREALPYQLVAQATDRWGPPKSVKVALIYANLGNLPEARGWLQTAMRRWPNSSGVRAAQLYIAAFCDQPADGLAMIESMETGASPGEEETPIWRNFIQAKAAHSGPVTEETVRKIKVAAEGGIISRDTEILMLAGLGKKNEAVAAANLALDHQRLDPKLLFAPVLRDVRRSPGFVGLASRMGLLRYWRETGKPPDFCADGRASNECSQQLLDALSG